MNTIKQKALVLSQNLKTLYASSHAITVAWWLLEKLTQKNNCTTQFKPPTQNQKKALAYQFLLV